MVTICTNIYLHYRFLGSEQSEVYAACKNDCKGTAGPDYRVGYFHIFNLVPHISTMTPYLCKRKH